MKYWAILFLYLKIFRKIFLSEIATDEKMNTNGLVFRAARQDDKAELMAMSEDVYAGLDYLPAYYDQWIMEAGQQHPTRFNFVGVLEDRVVAFFSLLFFSQKTSLIMCASRVHPDLRERGIYKKMDDFKSSFVKSLTPSCWKISSFTDNWSDDESLIRLKASKGEELVKRNPILIRFDPKIWKHHRKDIDYSTGEFSNFEIVGEEFLENVLEDGYWRSLLNNGVLHINWDPYIPRDKKDIKYIASIDLTIIKDAESFSIFHNSIPIPSGFRVGLDIFCQTFDKFAAHIVNQLDRFAKSAAEGETKLCIFSPLEWTEDLLRFLKGSCKMEDNSFLRIGGMAYRPWPTMFVYRKKN